MRSEAAQIALYLLVLKVAVGAVCLYAANKKKILDIRTFAVIAFFPFVSVVYVLLKKDSAEEGMSVGAWIYIVVTAVEAVIVSILRTLPT